MKHKILLIYSWIVRSITFFWPDIPIMMRIRGMLYSVGLKKCGKNFQITHNAILNTLEDITIGQNVYIANNCVLIGGGEINIGNNVLIGPGVIVACDNHRLNGDNYRFGDVARGTINISNGCWIGANSCIVANTLLPSSSILAANSVLTKKYECEYSLYGGVPAAFIKNVK